MQIGKAPLGFVFLLFTFAFAGPLAAQSTNRVNEAQVHSLLKSLDAAYLKLDVGAVGTNFAEDAVITIELHEGGKVYPDKYDKKEYLKVLETGFSAFTNYTAERSQTRIEIAADGKSAKVQSTFVEKFRLNGEPGEGSSDEHYDLVLVGGNLRIKTMNTVARMK